MANEDQIPGGGRPYGDIFAVSTPALDKVSLDLAAQHQARRAYNEKISTNIDESLNKELGNVRSADMPLVTDAYNKWKTLQQQALFNNRIQNNPTLYNQAQQQSAAAYADVASKIRKSTELANQAKELVAARQAKPNLYSDDFGDKMGAFLNTPMDQLANHPKYGDLSNFDSYRYQGGQTDFSKLDAGAKGALKNSYLKTEDISPLQQKVTPYQFGNTPAEYFETLKGAYVPHQAFRDASAAWDAIPQAQRDEVDRQFQQIPIEKWQQMGVGKPQVIAPSDPTNPAENLAAYKAKLYAINEQPRPGTEKVTLNKQAQMNLAEKQKERFEGIREGNREALAKFRIDYGNQADDVKAGAIDQFLNDSEEKAKAAGKLDYKPSGGQPYATYKIAVRPEVKELLSSTNDKGHKEYPDEVRIDDNGNYMGLFFQKKEGVPILIDGKHPISESIPTKIVPKDVVRSVVLDKLLPKKSVSPALGTKPTAKPASQTDAQKKAEELLKKYGVQ